MVMARLKASPLTRPGYLFKFLSIESLGAKSKLWVVSMLPFIIALTKTVSAVVFIRIVLLIVTFSGVHEKSKVHNMQIVRRCFMSGLMPG
jgi:hypothetical protein